MRWFGQGRGEAGQSPDAAAEAAFTRGQREFDAGRFDAAAAMFRQAVALAPDSPNSQFLLGAALLEAGEAHAAIGPLRRCIAMRPEHAIAHLTLGVALGRLHQFDEADVHVARAASLGDQQARERLLTMGADFCRRCARPVTIAAPSSTAITYVGPKFGMHCAGCHTVVCVPCALNGQSVSIGSACPDCGDPLRVLTRPPAPPEREQPPSTATE